MEKMVITSGENKVNVDTGLTGNGTSENPLQYTGEIQHSDKRSLLWESTANGYNTNIQLSEPITHFDKVMIYGSGLKEADTMHLSKNVYTVQPGLINGCDAWCYSPWNTSFQANYILGADLKLSGNSGHIGSSYYWGIGSKNATWAAGKWTGTEAPKMLMPWKIFGLGRHPTYNFFGLDSEGGTVSADPISGYSGDTATLTAIPESEVWKCSAIDITGATLTGNDFMFGNSNVTASAGFEHSRDLTLENGEHGVLSADKMSGFSGDVVTVDATTDEGWYLSAIALTGAEATGFKFMFTGSDVTVNAVWAGPEDVRHLTLQNDGHGTLAASKVSGLAGETALLTPTNASNYIFSGFTVTGATIANSALTYGEQDCTAKAWFKYGWDYRPMTTWTKASKSNNTIIITNNRVQIKGVGNWNELLYRTFSTTAGGTYKLSMDWTAPNGLTFWSNTASYRNCGLWVSTALTASKTNSYEGPTGTGILMQNSNNTSKITKSQTANISIQANKTYYLWFSFGTLNDGVSNMYIDFNKLTFEKV